MNDCLDGCPSNDLKTSPGSCGCEVADSECIDVDVNANVNTDSIGPEGADLESVSSGTTTTTTANGADEEPAVGTMARMEQGLGYGDADTAAYGYAYGR